MAGTILGITIALTYVGSQCLVSVIMPFLKDFKFNMDIEDYRRDGISTYIEVTLIIISNIFYITQAYDELSYIDRLN